MRQMISMEFHGQVPVDVKKVGAALMQLS